MTQDELMTRIRLIMLEPKCSIWNLSGDYYGDQEPLERCGFRVCWSSLNLSECPSEEEINRVTQEQVNEFRQQEQDTNLYNQYKDDISMKAFYNFQKTSNPSLTFIDFLKSVQNTEV